MQHASVIAQFVVEEFLPDVAPADVDVDLDLVDNGVIDSLGLLKVIAWLEDRFGIAADDVELSPEHFRSIRSIDAFVVGATTPPVEAKLQ
uniref:Peptidyl carrier protein n=1 Tax=Micromonospora okii TaxID=1182970 RepID=UPI0007446E3A|nr:Chain A, Peptidyl carrier protein [Micromonospora okii]5WPX_A Chain A, Peptidyl carrier protein [Micromonospora okii]5WPY_A Chain A, Peptidyl carrier protein [Micromonospora okii]